MVPKVNGWKHFGLGYAPRRQQGAAELLATVFASFDDETVGTTKLLPTFTAQHQRRTQCGECGNTTKNGPPEPETILQVAQSYTED